MGRTFDDIDERLAEWIRRQHVFFVGTAPTDGGHVNVSPKGLDTLRILGPNVVAYLDLTGSGAETIAHLRDNGRLTIMFCAFDGPPRIVRLQGVGAVTTLHDEGFAEAMAPFADHPGARAVISLTIDRVADSCGFSVPLMEFVGERDVLTKWAARQDGDELEAYRSKKNTRSIDGLPAWPDTRVGQRSTS